MAQQGFHSMLPTPTHDEAARENYSVTFRNIVMNAIPAGERLVYEQRAAPSGEKMHGRRPSTRHEARKLMERDPYGQMSSALRRISQEVLWDTVSDSIERDLPDLVARAQDTGGSNQGLPGAQPGHGNSALCRRGRYSCHARQL